MRVNCTLRPIACWNTIARQADKTHIHTKRTPCIVRPFVVDGAPPRGPSANKRSLNVKTIPTTRFPESMNEPGLLNRLYAPTTPRPTDAAHGRLIGDTRMMAMGRALVAWLLRWFTTLLPTRRLVIGSIQAGILVLGLLGLSVAGYAQATVDLSVHTQLDKSKPALGDVVTYTVVVSNAPSLSTATGVVVKNQLPDGGVAYLPSSAIVTRGSGSYDPATGNWTVGTLASGDSAVLTLKATVLQRGVWFNIAQVMAVDQADLDSTPNNSQLYEDDYEGVCFSVPIELYRGDEFTVVVPSGYHKIVWYRNNVDVLTVPADSAVVNSDSSLTIKSPGTYRFVTFNNGCPSSNCCDIEVIQGPYGSLGNFVFVDNNKDGIFNAGDTGLDGVKVYLYDQTGTTKLDSTVSANGGKYLFNSLRSGTYKVRFSAPGGMQYTQQAPTGTAMGSVAGADGFTGLYTIDTEKGAGDPGRDNMTVNAGFIPKVVPTATLGGIAFVDANGNGIRESEDGGMPGIVVTLFQSTTAGVTQIATTTTTASGAYSFTGIAAGSGYYVKFDTTGLGARGYVVTKPGATTNTALDSDAGPNGETAPFSLTAGQVNTTISAGFVPKPATISSLVFIDGNSNGQRDAGEGILPGVTVKLYQNGQSSPVQSLTTDVNGAVQFAGLQPGIGYYMVFDTTGLRAKGYGLTLYQQGNSATDSDADPVTGRTTSFTLTPGQVLTSINAGVKPLCPANLGLTLASVVPVCPGGTASLVASTSISGATVNWYTSTTSSQPFATVSSGTSVTVAPAQTTIYYVSARTADGCVSPLQSATVNVTTVTAPVLANNTVRNTCPATTVNLTTATISNSDASLNYEWYTSATRAAGTLVGNLTTANAGTYYVFAKSASGCYSSPATLTAVVVDCGCQTLAGVNAGPAQTSCGANPVTLVASLSGSATSVTWSSNGTGTFSNPTSLTTTFTPSAVDVNNASVVISATTNDPDGAGVCVAGTSSLVLTINKCKTDLVVAKQITTPGSYSLGQTVSYAITVSNAGKSTASSVTVLDKLPASLSFVSANPASDYNAGSGVWTVGSLTAGAQRSLTIQATIVGTGSVRNTAVVQSPDNDLALGGNDTSRVDIQVNGCTAQAPTIASSISDICKGSPATLTATGCTTGTIRWSDGQTGPVVSVIPTVNTTYTAICVQSAACASGASNAVSITVRDLQAPTLTPSATSVCPGGQVTLTASGCTGGTYQWSTGSETGASIVVSPSSRTTYTVQCRIGACVSAATSTVIDVTETPAKPTIVASTSVVCPGEQVTLTVNGCTGTPMWSNTTATTGQITVSPTTGNNTYTVYCKNGACVSPVSDALTIRVTTPAVPTLVASTDSTCSGGKVTLTANGCEGTVLWSNGQTGASITVTPTSTISYTAQCKFRDCLSATSVAKQITVVSPTTPIVKADKLLLCSGERLTLTAEGCNGTVRWTGTDAIGASINIMPTETREYYATCQIGTCQSTASNRLRVTVTTTGTPPTIAASTTATCSGGSVTLTATGCTGTVVWSDGQTGATVSVSATAASTQYYAVCRVGTNCASGRSNTITITTTSTAAPTIAANTSTICPGNSVTLTASGCAGTPVWSTGDNTASIVVSPTVNTNYTVYCQNGSCRSANSTEFLVTVSQPTPPTISASSTTVVAGGTVTLTATGCSGDIVWSAAGIDGSNTGASIVVKPEGTQTYYAQCKIGNCVSAASAGITVNQSSCTARAGTLLAKAATVCADANGAVVAAVVNGGLVHTDDYSVLYLLTTGANKTIAQLSPAAAFTVAAQSAGYTINTLVYDGRPSSKNYLDINLIKTGLTTIADVSKLIADRSVCADVDLTGASIAVTYTPAPVLSASTSLTTCAGSPITLTAQGCDGGTVTWSDNTVGASITRTPASSFSLTATCTLNGCTSSPSQPINVVVGSPQGIPSIVGTKTTICLGETVSLTATGCTGGTLVWSDGQTTGSVLTAAPTTSTSYRVKCVVGSCESGWSAFTPITVGATVAPTVLANGASNPTVCAGATVVLTAQGCPDGSTIVWSNQLTGTSITVTPTSSTTYSAICRTSASCQSPASAVQTVTVLAKPTQPQVADKSNNCPATVVDLRTAVISAVSTNGGSFEFYTSPTLSSTALVANSAAVGTGTYYVVEKAAGGCYSDPAIIRVQITTCGSTTTCDPATLLTINAGPDAVVCGAKSYRLQGSVVGTAGKLYWTSTGNGTFDNPFSANAIYTASVEDILVGKVTLTLSASAVSATCPVVTDNMILTIEGPKTTPTIVASGPLAFCSGDSITLTAPDGASGYLWSNRAVSKSIVVKTTGQYTVQTFDANGCSSPVSAATQVSVSAPLATPIVNDIRNNCPALIANLNTALSTTAPAGSSYEYRTGAAVTSARVLRPDSVGAGTYYVFLRNSTGCVSSGAPVVVNIVRCQGDTLPVELALVKTADKTVAKVGDAISYTLRVTNNSQRTAHNISVRDILPTTVQVQSTTATSYSVSNGVVTARIDSLIGGASRSIVIPVSVIGKGAIVNRADITYVDERDSNLSNNTSSVTVRDTVISTPGSGTSVLGLAKAVVGTPTLVGDTTLNVRYRFVATNFGGDTLRNVQITDDLAFAFASARVKAVKFETIDPNFTLVYQPSYTGGGNTSSLFDSTSSYIAPGRSQTFILDVTVIRRKGDTTMTYRNIASGIARGMRTLELSTDGSNPDPDGDRNPLNNTSFTVFRIDTTRQQQPALGVALAVINVVDKQDGSYNVTYRATLKNFGNRTLYGVTLTDTLAKAFPSPTVASIVGSPTVRTGSNLVPNGVYNGTTNLNLLYGTSTLAAGEQDTITYVINVRPNGINGIFYTSITGSGATADSVRVYDISNNGFDPNPLGTTPTPVRFDLTGGVLGVAKAVGTPVEVQSGIYDVPYTIKLVNRGGVALNKVQVVDNLSQTFGNGVLIVSNQVSLTADAGLTVNPAYTGQGRNTSLLIDSLSTLPVGTSRSVSFVVRVDVRSTDSTRFYNRAIGSGLANNVAVTDTSAAGTNDDPNNNLDPRDDSQPTPVVIGPYVGSPHIGLAKAVTDTARQADGSYNVTYSIVVRNFGNEVLRRVSVVDTLSNVFNTQTGAVYRIVRGPFTTSTGSALKLNSDFDGNASPYLVLGDSTSTLAVGKVDTIRFVINVTVTTATTATFPNSAYGTAVAQSGVVSDRSTNGLVPDVNGNNNPGDSNESQPTPITLSPTNSSFFIPEGFSPNGDGVNDRFVIRGATGLTISLEVYNRWGHVVYKNDNYQNDWDGTANTGILLDGDKGLPDGTYYYIVRTSDGRRFVRYMTIYR
ncbi:SdrD B-like domain-containing protein [Spirosoma oryzae]|nr:SdrD B-like domain-containing protein [Spirosoma oryzae]